MKAQPTAVGCSIYAGLFTTGVKAAGFRVLAHLEQDAYGTDTAIVNHPELDIYVGKETWPDAVEDFKVRPKSIDFVYCNPPCAVWSAVGKSWFSAGKEGGHWRDDPRLQHAYDALSLVERYSPAVWAWESVPMALRRGHSVLVEMAAYGRARGYACSVISFNAVNIGVPQSRPRIFVVLHRVAFEPGTVDHDKIVTVREAWKKLPKSNSEYNKCTASQSKVLDWMLKHNKGNTASMRNAFMTMHVEDMKEDERGRVIGRPAISDKRLSLDDPGRPMLAKSFHPTESRYLTVGEAMRLCQVPDDWKFGPSAKSPDAKKCLLQRAVMPRVGEWLARAVKAAIETGKEADTEAPALVYDLSKPERQVYALGEASGSLARSHGGARVEPEKPGTRMPKQKASPKATEPKIKPRPPPSKDIVDKARRVCAGMAGSGARIRALLTKGGLSDDAIADKVRNEFPGRKTTRADVAWNRGMMRKAGLYKEQ